MHHGDEGLYRLMCFQYSSPAPAMHSPAAQKNPQRATIARWIKNRSHFCISHVPFGPRASKNFFNRTNFDRFGRRGEESKNFGKWFFCNTCTILAVFHAYEAGLKLYFSLKQG